MHLFEDPGIRTPLIKQPQSSRGTKALLLVQATIAVTI